MSTSGDLRVIEAAIREGVRRGFLEVIPSDDGVLCYQLTESGLRYFNSVLDEERED